VIFDLDGTIADTSEGILDSHRYTLDSLNRQRPSETELRGLIGGNLLKTYIDVFGFPERVAKTAVKTYRRRYSEVGIHMASVYPGFIDMLRELKAFGYRIGVATLKADVFAKAMLIELGVSEFFDAVCGVDENDELDKAGLILQCCQLCGCHKEEAMLVGDTDSDYYGSRQAGVRFIGVTYGFGYRPNVRYSFKTVGSPEELTAAIKEI
jgi:phosphoglycolate phosphatase